MIWDRKEACLSAIVGGYVVFKVVFCPLTLAYVLAKQFECVECCGVCSHFTVCMMCFLFYQLYILLILGIKEYFKMHPVWPWWKFLLNSKSLVFYYTVILNWM